MDHRNFLQRQMTMQYFQWINMENRHFLDGLLEALTLPATDALTLQKSGEEIFRRQISFSKMAIFLDLYAQQTDATKRQRLYQRRDTLAEGYLRARLPGEIKSIKTGLHNNPNLISGKNLRIVDELMAWMQQLVNGFLKGDPIPPITERIEPFVAFVRDRGSLYFDDSDVREDFLTTNRQLYECAQEAVLFFQQKAFYHFTLVYIELVALFLKMTTLLGNMFLEEELLSVYIDPITHLPNRFQLLKDRAFFPGAYLLIVNIKSFSKLNILYGYETGDAILKKCAAYLKSSCALKSYRIYGDEFAVLLSSREEIETLFERLNRAISVVIGEITYDIYFYGAFDRFEETALQRCEFALINGPKRGVADAADVEEMLQRYEQEITLTQRLKEAMIQDEIVPYYQPIYANADVDRIIKYEVLMRVRSNGEILTPGTFLTTLKEAPFYTEFTKSILLKSFELFRENDLTFSVNFTLADIQDKGVRLFLETLIARYPTVARRLTIEITEAEALQEFDELNRFIRTFRSRGVRFSLDDFGSGYANFAQFAKLDIDFIKIDGTIVTEVLTDEKMQKLLDSILKFAHTFDLKVIAEYVCSRELFDALKARVDMLQGYFIGKPLPYLREPFSDPSSQTSAT